MGDWIHHIHRIYHAPIPVAMLVPPLLLLSLCSCPQLLGTSTLLALLTVKRVVMVLVVEVVGTSSLSPATFLKSQQLISPPLYRTHWFTHLPWLFHTTAILEEGWTVHSPLPYWHTLTTQLLINQRTLPPRIDNLTTAIATTTTSIIFKWLLLSVDSSQFCGHLIPLQLTAETLSFFCLQLIIFFLYLSWTSPLSRPSYDLATEQLSFFWDNLTYSHLLLLPLSSTISAAALSHLSTDRTSSFSSQSANLKK